MPKILRKAADKALGIPMRASLRGVVHRLIRMNYTVTIIGAEAALSCTEGAIVVSNHISRMDAVVIMSEAWPYARVWPTAWWREYYAPLQWPLMWLFSAIPLGSDSQLPIEMRREAKERSMEAMRRVLAAMRHLLIFAEGGISDGAKVTVKRHLTGVHDLIEENPEKPILMVRLSGLERSLFGKAPEAMSLWRRLFSRIPVTITIERFDYVSLQGGASGLNERIERYYNDKVPLLTERRAAA